MVGKERKEKEGRGEKKEWEEKEEKKEERSEERKVGRYISIKEEGRNKGK